MSLDPGRQKPVARHVCFGRVGFSPVLHVFTGLPPLAFCGAGELHARTPGGLDITGHEPCMDCRDALGTS